MLSIFDLLHINPISLIVILLAVISLSIVIYYYLFIFLKLNFQKKKYTEFNKPISIIICAKNELKNLKENLPDILAQNYFNFEVIVVNDQSTDSSKLFLEELSKKYKKLVIVNIDNFVKHTIGKKFPLTLGIKTAKNEYLILTDADCKPNSKDWVKLIASNFNYSNIILGYGSYKKHNGLLNRIIRFDTFNIAQQYLSLALVGYTYMGVGRNLAYKKSIFFENKGFASHIHIPSGDDDLFIQEIASKNTISVETSLNSHTTSEVINTWKEWRYQKRRHLSTAPYYKRKIKLILALYPLSQIFFWISISLLFVLKTKLLYIILLLTIKLFSSYLINYKAMKKLNILDLYWGHPIYEILHLLLQGNFVLLNLFSKPKKWTDK